MNGTFKRRLGLVGLVGLTGLALLLPATACASRSKRDALLVSVAVSLAPAIGELAQAYEAGHPGATIQLNTGASGILLQQILRGAPVDLFISASAAEMDRLAQDGRIERGRWAVLASNRLVLVTRAGANVEASALEELSFERYGSISVANPRTAPLGRYTRQALTSLDVWDTLGARAVQGENARQVIEYVARGEVEAGIVYASDAQMLAARVVRGPTLDNATHEPITYLATVLDGTPHALLAQDFLRYVRSAAGSEMLRRHGFLEARE